MLTLFLSAILNVHFARRDQSGMAMPIFGIELAHYVVCAIGAFLLYFKLQTEGKEVIRFSAVIKKDWKEKPAAVIIDAVAFTVLGSLIAGIITQPTTPQQALAAGLGWTGLLSAFSKED